MKRALLLMVVALPFLLTSSWGVQDWNFSLHRFDYNSSDLDLLTLKMRSSRKEPGVYALNGTAEVGIPIDKKFSMEIKIYRSPTGNGEYKLTPYHARRMEFCDFLQNFYIPMVQKDLESCSDLPIFDETCETYIKKGTYAFNMCLITSAGMPSHLQPGFYKIVAHLSSEDLSAFLTLYGEAEPKNLV